MNFSDYISQQGDSIDTVDMLSPEYNFARSQIDMARDVLDAHNSTMELLNPTPNTLDSQLLALIDSVPLE